VRKRLTIAAVAVVVLAVVAGGLWWWHAAQRTDFQRAAGMAPPEAERLLWTDWTAVRARVGADDLSTTSAGSAVTTFLDRGFEADLTSTSALVQSAPVLQEKFGFSPATVDWELFSQSEQGAVVMLHLPDGTDFGDIADRLDELGYTRPSSDTGVWSGGEDLLGTIGVDLTPELQFISLDAADGLLFTSDTADYLPRAVADASDGDGAPDELRAVVDKSGEPLSAAVYDSDYTCSHLAMSSADQTDQDQAAELVRAAGKVNPVSGFAMSVQPDHHVRVVLSFENDDQARTNADSRATLAAGPAPGQGGDFTDRFSVGPVTADGRFVTMDLKPVEGAYVLSDLSSGPVLFATC
jgi:hypothetical protein